MRATIGALVALCAVVGLAACGGSDDKSKSSSSAGGAEGKTHRPAAAGDQDHALRGARQAGFEARSRQLCPTCKIVYANANQDPDKQQQQAEAALTDGAEVLVLDAVDAKSATAIVTRAKQSNVPVIAYDRLIPDADSTTTCRSTTSAGRDPGAVAHRQARRAARASRSS